MNKERISNVNIFPVSYASADRAFHEFFKPVTRRTQAEKNVFEREREILTKYYPQTQQYISYSLVYQQQLNPEMSNSHFFSGMNFVHFAARTEAQIKQTVLPQISPDQHIKYLLSSNVFDFNEEGVPTKINFEPAVENFRASERNLQNVMTPLQRGLSHFDSFEKGGALMWDFLKKAPHIQTPK